MITLLNNRLLLFICMFLSIGILASCDKSDESSSDKIELLSFGPTGAKHGDTLRFIGQNLNQVTAIEFTGVTVEKNAFISQSGDLITVKVPQQAEQGFIKLKTPQGDITSKTKLNFEVPIVITSVTASARPGENISIKGNLLNWVDSITSADKKVVKTFVSKSLSEIVVMVPMDAKTGKLLLAGGGTKPGLVETTNELNVVLPMITGMAPNPVKHGTNLTLTGTNMDLAKQVILPGATKPISSFVSQNATQIVVVVDSATVKGKVKLMAQSGVETQSTQDVDMIMPAITAISPNPIDAGANLTITGTNLDLVNAVSFQNAPAVKTFVSQSASQLVVKVPTGVTNGKVTFGILNSKLAVQSPNILEINGAAPPPTIALPIYNDAITSNWNGWVGNGWGGSSDRNNTSPVREGAKSVKIIYNAGADYGSPFQIGGANISLAPYRTIKFSIYGAPGSNGKSMQLKLNGGSGPGYSFSVVEGKWTDYEVSLSSLSGITSLTEIWVQDVTGTGGYTVYLDALGLN